MKTKQPEPIARASIGNPMRRHNRTFNLFVEGGLFRAEEVDTGLLWKLDDLHEALILQVLRERRKAARSKHKVNHLLGNSEELIAANEEIDRLNATLTDVGNRGT